MWELIEDVEASHLNDRGLFWNRQARSEMEEVEVLFDARWRRWMDRSSHSVFARISRTKWRFSLHVLDFIFNSSRQVIVIPDAGAMNDQRSKDIEA